MNINQIQRYLNSNVVNVTAHEWSVQYDSDFGNTDTIRHSRTFLLTHKNIMHSVTVIVESSESDLHPEGRIFLQPDPLCCVSYFFSALDNYDLNIKRDKSASGGVCGYNGIDCSVEVNYEENIMTLSVNQIEWFLEHISPIIDRYLNEVKLLINSLHHTDKAVVESVVYRNLPTTDPKFKIVPRFEYDSKLSVFKVIRRCVIRDAEFHIEVVLVDIVSYVRINGIITHLTKPHIDGSKFIDQQLYSYDTDLEFTIDRVNYTTHKDDVDLSYSPHNNQILYDSTVSTHIAALVDVESVTVHPISFHLSVSGDAGSLSVDAVSYLKYRHRVKSVPTYLVRLNLTGK
jgi:hypothetical protein